MYVSNMFLEEKHRINSGQFRFYAWLKFAWNIKSIACLNWEIKTNVFHKKKSHKKTEEKHA